MIDPTILSICVVSFIVASIWLTINHCADAELHGNRTWWRKAQFRARQRVEYKEFCRDAERHVSGVAQEYTQQHEE